MHTTLYNLTTRKAKIIDSAVAYCKSFSGQIGHNFTAETIRLSALTGAAATEIRGDTLHREYSLNRKTDEAKITDLESFQDTRLHIIDEISFATHNINLCKLNTRLQAFTECREHIYGNQAIVFMGDFCQLDL